MSNKSIGGTREWANTNVNCMTGCEHNCRYCYARYNALRFKQIASIEDWARPRIRDKDVYLKRKKLDGVIMFPSTHDITPKTLGPCMAVLYNLLSAGNQVLIVSKPHLSCIQEICQDFRSYREQITFRFTIGAISNQILKYWEPGAPSIMDRMDSLEYAYRHGYRTSISCEPLLEAKNAGLIYAFFKRFVSDTIWFGSMNKIDQRVIPGTDPEEITRIKAWQTPDRIAAIYAELKDNPKVRWKESYKKVLGLELVTEAGTDT